MKVHGKSFRSIWRDPSQHGVRIIDQTLLPFAFEEKQLVSMEQAVDAIRGMRVRGAPLIGVTAAYGVALAMREDGSNTALDRACRQLQATRPTAVNLAWALARMKATLTPLDPLDREAAAWHLADELAEEDVATNAAIGRHGAVLLKSLHQQHGRTVNVLTHCNAGWIATVDWGTALSAIYHAHDEGTPVHVWVEETRPRNQGLLTAWELREHGVPHTYIVDNAGGHLMQHGQVDIVLVGADRVSRRGDVANKIGTYLKALSARDNDIPFYAAVPSSTIDWNLNDALAEIEIEQRHADEVRILRGRSHDGLTRDIQLLDPATPVANPGFDVTPARLVTGIVTERGIVMPDRLESLFRKST
jgi:methylthioribose-1-phosphate isomerase